MQKSFFYCTFREKNWSFFILPRETWFKWRLRLYSSTLLYCEKCGKWTQKSIVTLNLFQGLFLSGDSETSSEWQKLHGLLRQAYARYLTNVKYFVRTLHVLTVAHWPKNEENERKKNENELQMSEAFFSFRGIRGTFLFIAKKKSSP